MSINSSSKRNRKLSIADESDKETMGIIANYIGTEVKGIREERENPQYRVRTVSLATNVKMESYLDQYPLLSSKFMDYQC
jgi:hypothetical protein